MNPIMLAWRDSLSRLLDFYEAKRGSLIVFYPLLFLFFVAVNIAFYWWAMFTAFPELTYGRAGVYYFKVQFPVGILGALFDSLSFFVTIFIIRRALNSKSAVEYIGHLSLDLVIAILATFWVVFVFTTSGWIISVFEGAPKDLVSRSARYERMVVEAVVSPTDNLRNIYFGLIMGISAMLPTCIHVYMFVQSVFRNLKKLGLALR